MMTYLRIVLSSMLLLVPFSWTFAQNKDQKPSKKMSASTFSGLKMRSIGPAFMSGRIADIAIDQKRPNTWYVAAGSGNLWKTTNAGTTWTPIFEKYGSYSIGCVTIDPNNRHTIWVGTGESVGGRHVGYGDGVYRSLDGGRSFQKLGLEKSEHIAKILVDPRNSNVVYVAAQGPLWSPGGERGLYKSTNGGKTWQPILTKGKWTGVTDVVFDPRNPDVLYAATHQRHRIVAALINGGPESGIWKTTDGGKTWRELKKGLPTADMGKISLGVSPQKSNVIYATIELAGRSPANARAGVGGFWRSADGGETWRKMSDYLSGGTGPHYYQEIWVDPHRFDVIYQADVNLHRSEDGGKTWKSVQGNAKHTDNHAVVFHPTDTDFVLVGCDGGLYQSNDYTKTWRFFGNLPLTQFYKVDVDYDLPFYHVVGGTQDNATQYGPSRTKSISGIRNSDWRLLIFGDGHDCAIDPKNPNIIYCESQQGFLRRFDRRTGESIDIRPQPSPGEEGLRFNWDSPILISPHSNKRLYFGSKKLHRSDDHGDSWKTISGDLSRNIDRFKLKIMDRVWSIDAVWDLFAMSQYGNITAIAESPKKEGLIYVGTDDGLIQVTETGGNPWRKIDSVPGVPKFSLVNDIKADLFDENTVYAAFDNHQTGDLKPYLCKSTDRGKTWKSIVGDLPPRHIVWRIIQDHVNKDLLFVGTEFGIYFTVNGGKNWIKVSGTPVIPFRDLEIQRRENDLVGASFGRGFYVFDDYTPLRTVNEKMLKTNELVLFPVKKALLYIEDRPLYGPKGFNADAFFAAKNPPFGAVFTYYIRDSYKTRKQKRQAKETKIKKAGGDNPYPGFPALTKEEREEDPVIVFTVTDAEGNVVSRVTGPTSAGFHRVAWKLSYSGFSKTSSSGPLVVPGTYKVQAHKRVDDKTSSLGKPMTFRVVPIGQSTLPRQDRKKTLAFQMKLGKLQNALVGASNALKETLDQLKEMKKAIQASRATAATSLYSSARDLELKLLKLQVQLSGDKTKALRSKVAKLSVSERLQTALRGVLGQTYGPTKTHSQQYEIASQQYRKLGPVLKRLVETEFDELKRTLDKAGVPWTSGRRIPIWNE